MKFHVKICPLCGKDLVQFSSRGLSISECLQKVFVPVPPGEITHYQVELNSHENRIIQHILVPPYAIDTYANDWKSRIFKADEEKKGWEFVMETCQLHPDDPENLLQRIRRLVPFS